MFLMVVRITGPGSRRGAGRVVVLGGVGRGVDGAARAATAVSGRVTDTGGRTVSARAIGTESTRAGCRTGAGSTRAVSVTTVSAGAMLSAAGASATAGG